jgi:hypothetical protein
MSKEGDEYLDELARYMEQHQRTITPDTLPEGVWFDKDGGTWRAVKTTAGVDDDRDWWRWQPLNSIALGKGEPDGRLSDHAPLGNKSLTLLKDWNSFPNH